MGPILHGCVTTAEALCRAIQPSQQSFMVLAALGRNSARYRKTKALCGSCAISVSEKRILLGGLLSRVIASPSSRARAWSYTEI
jgi:hypothetical protein